MTKHLLVNITISQGKKSGNCLVSQKINKTDKSAISKGNKCLDHQNKWMVQYYFN